jgi:hypothetical protein
MLRVIAFALLISGLTAIGAFAQSAVIITGVVKNAKAIPSPAPKDSVAVLITLTIRIENKGDIPVLFLTDHLPGFPRLILTKDSGPVTESNILFENYGGPTLTMEAEWKSLRKALDLRLPPTEKVKVLGPHLSWELESETVLRVPTSYRSFIIGGQPASWESLQKASPVFLRFEAQFWSVSIEKPPKGEKFPFGHMLQRRWRKVGELQLDPVLTQPMSLSLPPDGSS